HADQIVFRVVDDGVEHHCGFTSLTITDDQLALTTANRNHGVDCLDTSQHRFTDRLAVDDTRSKPLYRQKLIGRNRSFIVDRLAQRIYHTANHRVADRHTHDLAGAFDLVAFADLGVVAHQDCAHLVFVQVHRQSANTMRKFQHLAGHDL